MSLQHSNTQNPRTETFIFILLFSYNNNLSDPPTSFNANTSLGSLPLDTNLSIAVSTDPPPPWRRRCLPSPRAAGAITARRCPHQTTTMSLAYKSGRSAVRIASRVCPRVVAGADGKQQSRSSTSSTVTKSSIASRDPHKPSPYRRYPSTRPQPLASSTCVYASKPSSSAARSCQAAIATSPSMHTTTPSQTHRL